MTFKETLDLVAIRSKDSLNEIQEAIRNHGVMRKSDIFFTFIQKIYLIAMKDSMH